MLLRKTVGSLDVKLARTDPQTSYDEFGPRRALRLRWSAEPAHVTDNCANPCSSYFRFLNPKLHPAPSVTVRLLYPARPAEVASRFPEIHRC